MNGTHAPVRVLELGTSVIEYKRTTEFETLRLVSGYSLGVYDYKREREISADLI
jgi:hypothetical protein